MAGIEGGAAGPKGQVPAAAKRAGAITIMLGVDRMYAGDYDTETFGARLGLRPVKELS